MKLMRERSTIRKCIVTFSLFVCSSVVQPLYAFELYKDDMFSADMRGYFRFAYFKNDDKSEFRDAGSRFGFHFAHALEGGWKANASLEFGVNMFGSDPAFAISGGDSFTPADNGDNAIWTRLGFIDANHEQWGRVRVGKQWSNYYLVSGVTDNFEYFGGEASGTYNFRTDGGASGTGRADKALQYQNQWGGLTLALQFQATEAEVEIQTIDSLPTSVSVQYGDGRGATLLYALSNDIQIGIASNVAYAKIYEIPILQRTVTDQANIAMISFGKFDERGWYAAVNGYRSEYHEIDDQGHLFDAEGHEVYLQYRFIERWNVYGGLNRLEPQSARASLYKVDYGVLGVQRAFIDKVLFFAEYKLDRSRLSDGTELGDALAAGLKFKF